MTGRERMLAALAHQPTDRPPHFETMFELEQEAFGLQFPDRRVWADCSAPRKRELIARCCDIYERIVERYRWDALAVFWPWSDPDGVLAARERFGQRILLGSIVGGSVWSLESIGDWMQFATDLVEHPEAVHAEARRRRDACCAKVDRLAAAGPDFILLVNDIADNHGTFLAPAQMREFVLPYLAEEVAHIRELGVRPFVHTDGSIMAILDDVIALGADLYQSVDPMAGMDIAEVKRRCAGRLALMGNVQCNLLQDGPRDAIRHSARYCLEHAAAGGGYVFSTSNTIFPGMPLAHYEYMLEVFREFCDREGGAGADG